MFDVVIIGAGPAGAVAAAYLNNKGNKVLVLEKETFPRFVIGESLLPHCLDHLTEAGLIEAVKKQGFQKKTGATFYNGEMNCNFSFSEQYTKGWEWAWQVKRADFDQVLIQEAQRQGVEVKFNSEVKNVVVNSNNQKIEYTNKAGEEALVQSKFIIDASGYGRVLPKMFDLNIPSSQEARGSIFTHVVDENRSGNAAENIFVHSFNENKSWFWAIPFSDGITSVGIVGDTDLIDDYFKNDAEKFKDFLQTFEGLNNRFNNVPLIFKPQLIQGYSIGVKKMYNEGFVLCGNSTEFLDPIFSSGVTMATFTGLQAAKLVNQHLSGIKVDWKKDYEDLICSGIDVFRSYINAWYNGDFQKIIFSKNIDENFKRQICSVLSGYVWDNSNHFIKRHKSILSTLVKVIDMNDEKNN